MVYCLSRVLKVVKISDTIRVTEMPSREHLLTVHTTEYLDSLNSSLTVCLIVYSYA